MKKPLFINSNEILLVMGRNELDSMAQSGPFYEENDIIDFINNVDNAVQIFRIEPTTNRCEDISEEIAEFHIKNHENMCFENEISHDFILNSDAYHDLLDEVAKKEYEDILYGTYEQQHRLRLSDVI
ncbi:hypothetical protein V3564_02515 [Bartonella sp. B12(2025)]